MPVPQIRKHTLSQYHTSPSTEHAAYTKPDMAKSKTILLQSVREKRTTGFDSAECAGPYLGPLSVFLLHFLHLLFKLRHFLCAPKRDLSLANAQAIRHRRTAYRTANA
eukprot:2338783-Rhodomonas_salina.1